MLEMKSYLLKILYMNSNINKYEFQTQEFLLKGTSETIQDIADNEVKMFNDTNKKYGYKVDFYNLYEFIGGKSLKESESDK